MSMKHRRDHIKRLQQALNDVIVGITIDTVWYDRPSLVAHEPVRMIDLFNEPDELIVPVKRRKKK